jgi:hypothetical protein
MAKVSRVLMDKYKDKFSKSILRMLRFVDDFIVFYRTGEDVTWLIPAMESIGVTLKYTTEEPKEGKLKFLDIEFDNEKGLCWEYKPREGKRILNYKSNHSKVIKNGIVTGVLKNATKKSCNHNVCSGLERQLRNLRQSGFPEEIIKGRVSKLVKEFSEPYQVVEKNEEDKLTVGIPFYHTLSHHLMKIGTEYEMRTVFRFPAKMARLTSGSGREREECKMAPSTHTSFVECETSCVYEVPCSCGMKYLGQTCKCLNERLTQHYENVKKLKPLTSNLVQHIIECGCEVEPEKAVIIGGRSLQKRSREILEAVRIRMGGDNIISVPSIELMNIEYEIMIKDLTERDKMKKTREK